MLHLFRNRNFGYPQSTEEEKTMRASEGFTTTIKIEGENDMKNTTETTTSTQAKGKNAKGGNNMSTKAKGETTMSTKAKTTKTAKAPVNTEEDKMVTITINGIEIKCTEEQATQIMIACANKGNVETEPAKTSKTSKGTSSKGKTSAKASTKKETATETEKDTRTWTEKKAEYASQFTAEEKAEYVFKKNLERKAQKFAYENTKFEERVAKKEWNAAYKANLSCVMEAVNELITEGKAYTEMELVRDFFGTIEGIKKVRTDVKGKAKYVRA